MDIYSRRRRLFPSLRELSIPDRISIDVAKHMSVVMGSPHMKMFWMATCPSDGIVPVLEHLSNNHPEIPVIHVAALDPGPQGHALRIMERFSHLENFQCHNPLYSEIIAYLASLKTLSKLHIRMPWEYLSQLALDPSLSNHANTFSALKDLRLHHIQHPDLVLLFMCTISSQGLERLDLQFDVLEIQLASFMPSLLESISRSTGLQEVTLGTLNSEEPGDDFPLYDIAPLKRLRQLRSLRLTLFGFREAIVNQAIPDLAHAWPDIQFLYYNQNIPKPIEPTALTLEALALFAQHCPKLTALWLDLDATAIPPPLQTPIFMNRIELDLTWSLIDHESFADVAEYILSVMPNAYMYVNTEPDHSAETMYWYHMKGILPMLAKLRKDSPQGLVAASI